MILLSYVIISHPEWKDSRIKIFEIAPVGKKIEYKARLINLINTGRLPIAPSNIEIIEADSEEGIQYIINEKSQEAGLSIIGFDLEHIGQKQNSLYEGYERMGDILFVNASIIRPID